MTEVTSETILSKLKDHLWRLDNLYLVRNPEISTNPVPLKMKPEQRHLMENLHHRTFCAKARQIGCSTIIVMRLLDEVLFNSNTVVATIDYREVDCKSKLDMAASVS